MSLSIAIFQQAMSITECGTCHPERCLILDIFMGGHEVRSHRHKHFLSEVFVFIVRLSASPALKYTLNIKLPAPLTSVLPSSEVTHRWIHCFQLFTHASFIAMFKDHTLVFACVVLFATFCMLQAALSLADTLPVCCRAFICFLNHRFSRTWGLSAERQLFKLRKTKIQRIYLSKVLPFRSWRLSYGWL